MSIRVKKNPGLELCYFQQYTIFAVSCNGGAWPKRLRLLAASQVCVKKISSLKTSAAEDCGRLAKYCECILLVSRICNFGVKAAPNQRKPKLQCERSKGKKPLRACWLYSSSRQEHKCYTNPSLHSSSTLERMRKDVRILLVGERK